MAMIAIARTAMTSQAIELAVERVSGASKPDDLFCPEMLVNKSEPAMTKPVNDLPAKNNRRCPRLDPS